MRLIDIVLEWVAGIAAILALFVAISVFAALAWLIWTEYDKSQLTPAQLACIREAAK